MRLQITDLARGHSPADSAERGFALAAAIFALVVVGALVTGGFFAASQESRAGDSSRFATEAFYTAEQGLADVVGTRDRAWFDNIPIFASSGPESDTIMQGSRAVGQYTANVHRIGQRLFFVESTGEVLRGGMYSGATRTVGLMVRTMGLDVPDDRALQVYGGVRIGGNSLVDGNDLPPKDWEDCEDIGAVNGVVARDTSQVRRFGNGKLWGSPPKSQDPSLSAEDFLHLGDFSFDELAAMAEKVYSHNTTINSTAPRKNEAGGCDYEHLSNWGAPHDPKPGDPFYVCHDYFPIIYGQGDLKLNGNASGQGILLVEGDLHLTGGYKFYGIVIVKGEFKSTGTGGHVNGMALVYGDGEIDVENEALGNSVVQFSSCAIERAKTMNQWASRVIPLAQRSWIDLSGAGVTS